MRFLSWRTDPLLINWFYFILRAMTTDSTSFPSASSRDDARSAAARRRKMFDSLLRDVDPVWHQLPAELVGRRVLRPSPHEVDQPRISIHALHLDVCTGFFLSFCFFRVKTTSMFTDPYDLDSHSAPRCSYRIFFL